MTVQTRSIEISTRGDSDVIDLTGQLCSSIADSGIKEGTATVFVAGSTASLSTLEFEPGAVRDIKLALERIAPVKDHYFHHATWGDDNGSSHVRACLMGPSLSVPFSDGRPLLGQWQQVVLIDFDTRPRERKVIVQIIGE